MYAEERQGMKAKQMLLLYSSSICTADTVEQSRDLTLRQERGL